MWVNPNAHCASCVPTTGYVGKGKRGELCRIYSEALCPTCFNFNGKFPLFAKKSKKFLKYKDVLCLHLITKDATENF